jgi:chemotaxis protein histidine kinase CheA
LRRKVLERTITRFAREPERQSSFDIATGVSHLIALFPTFAGIMYTTRLIKLLLVALTVVCVAQASWIDLNKIHSVERRLVRRASPSQGPDDSAASATAPAEDEATQAKPDTKTEVAAPTKVEADPTSAAEASETPAEPTNKDTKEVTKPSATQAEPTVDESPATTAADAASTEAAPTSKAAEKSTAVNSKPAETAAAAQSEATQETESAAASATDDSTSAQPTKEAPAPTSSSSSGGKSQNNDDSSSAASESEDEATSATNDKETRTTAKPVTSTHIAVVTRTNSDGDLETMTTTSVSTTTPGLSSNDDDDSSSGMSTKTRNTVIGVVVGIGGAIVVGALGLMAWRIWGRKKQGEEADGLMGFNESNSRPSSNGPYHSVEKTEYGSVGSAGPQRSPFQSTLDTYHQPTPVNASSNF